MQKAIFSTTLETKFMFTVGDSTLVNGRGDWKSRLIWLDFCGCCGGGGVGVGDSWLICSVDTFGGEIGSEA